MHAPRSCQSCQLGRRRPRRDSDAATAESRERANAAGSYAPSHTSTALPHRIAHADLLSEHLLVPCLTAAEVAMAPAPPLRVVCGEDCAIPCSDRAHEAPPLELERAQARRDWPTDWRAARIVHRLRLQTTASATRFLNLVSEVRVLPGASVLGRLSQANDLHVRAFSGRGGCLSSSAQDRLNPPGRDLRLARTRSRQVCSNSPRRSGRPGQRAASGRSFLLMFSPRVLVIVLTPVLCGACRFTAASLERA
jgi:hypothetical protein